MDVPVENLGEPELTDQVPEEPLPIEEKQEQEENPPAEQPEKKWPGWPGESVFRILVPSQKVGGLIGRKGESIKKMCEESRARIKILDGPPGVPERAVMVSAKEEPDVSIPPAVDGLLRVHKRTVDGLDNESGSAPPSGVITTRLLVAASQAGSLIGRQGATIKSIQEGSGSAVRVLGAEDLPAFALQDDRIVEIQGEPTSVHKAVELIASHLRKFLVDRTVLPLFEMHMARPPPHSHMDLAPGMPPHQHWGPPPGPPNAVGYGNNPHFIPPRPHDNYFPPPDFPADKPPHPGLSMYGREPPAIGNGPPSLHGSQVTQHMQIPLSYADAVIGTAGASISYIRRASGATITIQETRGAPGEMTVEISGSASQVQTAQQLIQNFMAEAAGSTQIQNGQVLDTSFNASYPSQGSVYASPPPGAGHAAGAGGYGSAYGHSYGY